VANTEPALDISDVLHRIACDAQAIVRSLGHAYDEEDSGPRLDAAIALTGRMGALADMMQPVLGDVPPVAHLDEWLLARG
jgi:hypothetical protein